MQFNKEELSTSPENRTKTVYSVIQPNEAHQDPNWKEVNTNSPALNIAKKTTALLSGQGMVRQSLPSVSDRHMKVQKVKRLQKKKGKKDVLAPWLRKDEE